jgi:hypothetical protein
MDMRRVGRKEDPIPCDGKEGEDRSILSYGHKTGDGKWLEQSMRILLNEIKVNEAEAATEPQKSMRLADGADRERLPLSSCQR